MNQLLSPGTQLTGILTTHRANRLILKEGVSKNVATPR